MNIVYQRKILNQLKHDLSGLPDGKLLSKISHGFTIFYHSFYHDNKLFVKSIGGPKNFVLRNQLRKKHCLERMVSDIEANISLEEKFFSDYVPVGSNSYMDSLLASIPGSSRLEGFSFDLNLLICHDFNGAGKVIFHEDTAPKQEQRTLDTRLGFKVRSKSEIMIAQSLYSNGFSFAYEMPLVLNGVTYYPDFTIFLGDNKFAVWEHLGLTGLSSYNEKCCKKINSYLNHGFVFQETLFITSENSNSALDYAGIDAIISMLKSQMLL